MCRWTLVTILWMVLCHSSAEECAKVYKTARFCVSEADKAIVLSCPPRHAIEIKHAELRTVRPDATCSPMEDLSLAGNTTQDVGVCGTAMNVKPDFRLCSILSTCSTTLATLQDDCNYSPNAQVEIKYGCMAKFGIPNMDIAFAMPMTRDHEWRGSMAQIDSHYQALNGTFINTINTKCAIAVPSGTEFKLNMALSLFRGPGSSRCNQHILVQKNGSDESWEFCSGNSPHVMLPCDDQEQHFYVSFVTGDIRARAVFVFYARVHHDKDLKIVCGQDADWMFDGPQFRPVIEETTTSTPREDKEDDDTLNEQKNSEDFQHGELTENDSMDMMPIVVGCVAAAVVIMIVVLLIIFINYRKSPEYLDEKSSVTSSESGSNIAKLGDVYVDGEIKSKLMIGKNLTSLQKLGFQLPMQA